MNESTVSAFTTPSSANNATQMSTTSSPPSTTTTTTETDESTTKKTFVDWYNILKEYNIQHYDSEHHENESERRVLSLFRDEYVQKNQELVEKHESYKAVPQFYFKRHVVSELKQRARRDARTRFLEKKADNLVDEQDLEEMWNHLQKYQSPPISQANGPRLNYASYCEVGKCMSAKAASFFRPCVFNKFPKDVYGRISGPVFFHYVVRKVSLVQLRISLTCYDDVGAGNLREQDLENYVFELIEGLPKLDALEIDFYPYYVFTAVRKFVFFLDPLRKGKIPIKDIVASPILGEFNQLRQVPTKSKDESVNGWFSASAALRIYSVYLNLDSDRNGMLSRFEFGNFNGRSLTPVFVDRLFQECRMYESEDTGRMEMDYKTFLDFILAVQNADTPQGLQYFFKILDIDHKGYLTIFDLNYFFKAVVERMCMLGHERVRIEDVTNEIFDMVRPVDPSRITLQDLINSEVGHTVVGILTDVHGFWQYDNRENLVNDDQDT